MTSKRKIIYLIAGEASGDLLGARLMHALKEQHGEEISFAGIGGPLMEKEGLKSLFPMHYLSVMGISEILPKLTFFLKKIKEAADNIEKINPDIIVTIDAPDFSFRVAKSVQKRGNIDAKMVHYVAPTVWAWRSRRARKISKFLDGIMCLLPFEPPYFTKEGMDAAFVGHPFIESEAMQANGAIFRKKYSIAQDDLTLGLLLGSRSGELKRTAPVLVESVIQLARETGKTPHVIAPTLPHLEERVLGLLQDYPGPVHVVTDQDMKWHAFKACDYALAVSGTVGLELACLGVPHAIGYKMSPVTWHIIKRFIKVKYAHLANILFDKEVVPEFIQQNCSVENLKNHLNEKLMQKDQEALLSKELIEILSSNVKPADYISRFISVS